MDLKNSYDAQLVGEMLASSDFNSIHKYFGGLEDPSGYILFLKRNKKKLFPKKVFWTSALSLFSISEILKSDIRIEFLESYFDSDENCNPDLCKALFKAEPDTFRWMFKLFRAFEKPGFWQSLEKLIFSSFEVGSFIAELEIIKKKIVEVEKEEATELQVLLQLPFEKVLFGFALWYQTFKQLSPEAENNKSRQFQIEMAVVHSVNKYLKAFCGNGNTLQYFSNEAHLSEEWRKFCPEHFVTGKEYPLELIDADYELVVNFIKKDIYRQERQYAINLYLFGFADFHDVIRHPSLLKTNERFLQYKYNDTKSRYRDVPAMNKYEINARLRVNSDIQTDFLKFYGIPVNVNIGAKGVQVDLRKVFQLLLHLSVYKGPLERNFLCSPDSPTMTVIKMNKGSEEFCEIFGNNEVISMYDFDELKRKFIKFFKWSSEEIDEILRLITYDLDKPHPEKVWYHSPLLKRADRVYWVGVFLKDRDWKNIFYNKLKTDHIPGIDKNLLNRGLEKIVADKFQKAGFKSWNGFEFKTKEGIKGDIDVLAYKNGELIVIEVKSGIFTEDFSYTSYVETVRLEGCAAEQLDKILLYINSEWDEIKQKLGIETPKKIQNIKVIPFIVTDYFEGDLQVFKEKYHKLSLLELDVILRNDKKSLYEIKGIPMSMLFSILDQNSRDLNVKDAFNKQRNYDLWDGKKSISGEIILNCIQTNKVWNGIEQNWYFEPMILGLD